MSELTILCVQPNCGRRTSDFYDVDALTALALTGTNPGKTCARCYEDIIRRYTRERARFNFGSDVQSDGRVP